MSGGAPNLAGANRRYDALRPGLPDTERVADGEHQIANQQTVRIRELDRCKTLARILDTQYCEVRTRILQHDFGIEFALVLKRNLHLVGAFDHVKVGDDE